MKKSGVAQTYKFVSGYQWYRQQGKGKDSETGENDDIADEKVYNYVSDNGDRFKTYVNSNGSAQANGGARWFPDHHVVNGGQTIQDGQGSMTTVQNMPPIVLTVFSGSGANSMGGGANFSNNHPEVFMNVQYINLLAPDAGQGTNYSFTFFDFSTLQSNTFSQFVPSQPKINGLNAVVQMASPFTFGNLGGTININVQKSFMGGVNYDACWGADIYYRSWKR